MKNKHSTPAATPEKTARKAYWEHNLDDRVRDLPHLKGFEFGEFDPGCNLYNSDYGSGLDVSQRGPIQVGRVSYRMSGRAASEQELVNHIVGDRAICCESRDKIEGQGSVCCKSSKFEPEQLWSGVDQFEKTNNSLLNHIREKEEEFDSVVGRALSRDCTEEEEAEFEKQADFSWEELYEFDLVQQAHLDGGIGADSSCGANTEGCENAESLSRIFGEGREFGKGPRWNLVFRTLCKHREVPITAELLSKAKACEHVCQEMAKEYLSFLEDDMHLKKKVQEKVQNHLDKWARKCRFASNLVDGQRYWLQLMVSAMRDLNLTGEALECTNWRDIRKQFLGVVSPQHLCELEKTVFDGFEVHTPYERERVRGRLHKSAKDRLSEIFKIIWTDVSRGQTLLFPPKSLDLLKICAVECCAYGRVEKRSTATGLPKGVGS